MRRVLFVDDEQEILNRLRQMLGGEQDHWDMVFCQSAREALERMDAEAFEVVVSDLRMPEMDGLEFLELAKSRHPKTIRIVLSAHVEESSAHKIASVAHQCLAKPSSAEEIRDVVNRVCDLETYLSDPEIRNALGDVGDLPALSSTYHALMASLGRTEVDLVEVADVIKKDQGLSAKVLQLVNSSFFGVRQEILSTKQAVNYLGISTLKELLATAEVFRVLETTEKVEGFCPEEEQAHCFLTAIIARRLAGRVPWADHAFLAGMFHSLGKLLMLGHFPDRLATIVKHMESEGLTWHEAELSLNCVEQSALGAYLLGLWGMDLAVVEGVAHHHTPSKAPSQTMFGVISSVHVAKGLANEVSARGVSRPLECDHHYLENLGVLDQIFEWREMAEEEFRLVQAAQMLAPGGSLS